MSDTAEQIAQHNAERHNHYDERPEKNHCARCGSFVSKGEPHNGVYSYECKRCNQVVYEPVKTSLRSLEKQRAD